MIVAIHQPNYAPWLGYFAKIARSDVFVFLDDAQYSKNSYINRVQIDAGGQARWLTLPVRYRFGDPINAVQIADVDWRRAHLDILRGCYANAPAFADVRRWLGDIFESLPNEDLAATNQSLIEALARRLGLSSRFVRSSAIAIGMHRGDDRLISIVRSFGDGVTYLSGKGGANYQDSAKFAAAGVELVYSDFAHRSYPQGHDFLPGLSILDALFRLGFDRTRALFALAMADAAMMTPQT
jgi:hypothetical protein